MSPFPALDPIPLPAPVWLFKALLLLTFSLHVVAVQLFLGSLVAGTWWAFWGRFRNDPVMIGASRGIARRLPVVMIYLINLGVPPLLFTQVLYGRALYTSSVLIGAWWISVILLLLVVYYMLYVIAARSEAGRSWVVHGILALALAGTIATIYTHNMTLMVRPEVWLEMYRASPHGTHLSHGGDALAIARWHYMVAGGFVVSGLAMMVLGLKRRLDDQVAGFLRLWGARLIVPFALAQAVCAVWIWRSLPLEAREPLMAGTHAKVALMVWSFSLVVLAAAAGFLALRGAMRSFPIILGAAGVGFLNVVGMVLFRDAMRDALLDLHGYNVWERQVVTNWAVVVLFLVLFVAGLAGVGWLVRVMIQAKSERETYV